MFRTEPCPSKKENEQTEDDQLKNETEVASDAKIFESKAVEEETKAVMIIDTTDKKAKIEATSVVSDRPVKPKISYQKAMELQRQARDQQIPDDIPVLKRLNQSVQRFEKFRRLCTDYYRFRDKIKLKGAELLTSNSALIGKN